MFTFFKLFSINEIVFDIINPLSYERW